MVPRDIACDAGHAGPARPQVIVVDEKGNKTLNPKHPSMMPHERTPPGLQVIVVEDENGNIVRETMKDTDTLARYKTMHETLVYLSHLDHDDTETQMLGKLRLQVGRGPRRGCRTPARVCIPGLGGRVARTSAGQGAASGSGSALTGAYLNLNADLKFTMPCQP